MNEELWEKIEWVVRGVRDFEMPIEDGMKLIRRLLTGNTLAEPKDSCMRNGGAPHGWVFDDTAQKRICMYCAKVDL